MTIQRFATSGPKPSSRHVTRDDATRHRAWRDGLIVSITAGAPRTLPRIDRQPCEVAEGVPRSRAGACDGGVRPARHLQPSRSARTPRHRRPYIWARIVSGRRRRESPLDLRRKPGFLPCARLYANVVEITGHTSTTARPIDATHTHNPAGFSPPDRSDSHAVEVTSARACLISG